MTDERIHGKRSCPEATQKNRNQINVLVQPTAFSCFYFIGNRRLIPEVHKNSKLDSSG